jgi:hypothetical protein
MKLQSYTGGSYALSGSKEELRALSDKLVALLAAMDRHDADAAARSGERGIDPSHAVVFGLEIEPGIEALP